MSCEIWLFIEGRRFSRLVVASPTRHVPNVENRRLGLSNPFRIQKLFGIQRNMPGKNSESNSSHYPTTEVIEKEPNLLFDKPIVICGFVGPGVAGLTAAGYIIDHLELHEVAHVRSRFIPPAVIFIGGKIRSPFRIYKNSSGKIVVVVCEVPTAVMGLYDISATLLRWLRQYDPSEVVTLDGIPIDTLSENRPTFYVAQGDRQKQLEKLGFLPAEATLIVGTGGSILSECLAVKIPCISLLAPVSITLIDPGAPLTLVKALNSVYNLNIATKELEEDVEAIHEELNEIAKQYHNLQQQASANKPEGPQTMYN